MSATIGISSGSTGLFSSSMFDALQASEADLFSAFWSPFCELLFQPSITIFWWTLIWIQAFQVSDLLSSTSSWHPLGILLGPLTDAWHSRFWRYSRNVLSPSIVEFLESRLFDREFCDFSVGSIRALMKLVCREWQSSVEDRRYWNFGGDHLCCCCGSIWSLKVNRFYSSMWANDLISVLSQIGSNGRATADPSNQYYGY